MTLKKDSIEEMWEKEKSFAELEKDYELKQKKKNKQSTKTNILYGIKFLVVSLLLIGQVTLATYLTIRDRSEIPPHQIINENHNYTYR
jgi:hypothetical protein